MARVLKRSHNNNNDNNVCLFVYVHVSVCVCLVYVWALLCVSGSERLYCPPSRTSHLCLTKLPTCHHRGLLCQQWWSDCICWKQSGCHRRLWRHHQAT